jgi:hypothetical protein
MTLSIPVWPVALVVLITLALVIAGLAAVWLDGYRRLQPFYLVLGLFLAAIFAGALIGWLRGF